MRISLRTLRFALLAYGLLDFLAGYAGFFPITELAAAQFTVVTGTVTDPNGVPYKFGTIFPFIVVPSGAGTPTFCATPSTPYFPPAQATGLDVNGHFTVVVADNTAICPASTTWNFTVCSFQGTVNPAFGTGSQCFKLAAGITISGASQDITTQLNAAALALTLPFSNAGTGCVVAPLTNQSLVFIQASNCTTTSALAYNNFTANFLTVGAPGVSTGGYTVRGTTSGSAAWTTNATGTILFWSSPSGLDMSFDRDTATTPINYNRFRSQVAPNTLVADGFEFAFGGDLNGSGSAAGLKVTNAANTLDQSPGGNNSLTAGNSVGGTANSSHGGDNTITSGNYTGAGNNRGGDVVLVAGNSSGSGRGGNVSITTGTSSTGAAGQFLVNGTPFPTATILQQFTAVLGSNTPLPNSNTTLISQAITFPATGCPCRVHAAWTLYLTTGNSGFDAAYVCDTTAPACVAANGFAPGATTTTGSSNAFAMSAAGSSTVTYANNATVTFSLVGAGTHGGGGSTVTTAPAASPAISLTGLPNSELNLLVLSSN